MRNFFVNDLNRLRYLSEVQTLVVAKRLSHVAAKLGAIYHAKSENFGKKFAFAQHILNLAQKKSMRVRIIARKIALV